VRKKGSRRREEDKRVKEVDEEGLAEQLMNLAGS